jgi:hypothetical protein
MTTTLANQLPRINLANGGRRNGEGDVDTMVTEKSQTAPAWASMVSGSYFSMLGASAELGSAHQRFRLVGVGLSNFHDPEDPSARPALFS